MNDNTELLIGLIVFAVPIILYTNNTISADLARLLYLYAIVAAGMNIVAELRRYNE